MNAAMMRKASPKEGFAITSTTNMHISTNTLFFILSNSEESNNLNHSILRLSVITLSSVIFTVQ